MDRSNQQCGRNNQKSNYRSNCHKGAMYGCDRSYDMVNYDYNVNNSCRKDNMMEASCGNESLYLNQEDCHGMGRDPLAGMQIAMAYVPWQQFGNLYKECEAVYHGTIFADLDKGFYGVRGE